MQSRIAKIKAALEAIKGIIECTYDHDEDGERLDEQGDHSSSDIQEMLCNVEGLVDDALESITE